MEDLFDLSWLEDALGEVASEYMAGELPTESDVLDYTGDKPPLVDLSSLMAEAKDGWDNTPLVGDANGPLPQPDVQGEGVLSKLAKRVGMLNKEGSMDWTNPKQLDAWMRVLMGGANALYALSGRGSKPVGYKTPDEMRSQLAGASDYSKWTPQQQQWANNYFNTPVNLANRPTVAAATLPNPIQRRAQGGALSAVAASGGAGSQGNHGYVQGEASGQSDVVPAMLAPGEYVWDADVVSALGDGNNAAGALVLDKMRQNIRTHKRSASVTSIPPKAKDPHSYLPKGVLSQLKGAK